MKQVAAKKINKWSALRCVFSPVINRSAKPAKCKDSAAFGKVAMFLSDGEALRNAFV